MMILDKVDPLPSPGSAVCVQLCEAKPRRHYHVTDSALRGVQ